MRTTSPRVFCHGQGVQTLTDGDHLAVVDWGSCGAAPRMCDLAFLCFDYSVAFGAGLGAR